MSFLFKLLAFHLVSFSGWAMNLEFCQNIFFENKNFSLFLESQLPLIFSNQDKMYLYRSHSVKLEDLSFDRLKTYLRPTRDESQRVTQVLELFEFDPQNILLNLIKAQHFEQNLTQSYSRDLAQVIGGSTGTRKFPGGGYGQTLLGASAMNPTLRLLSITTLPARHHIPLLDFKSIDSTQSFFEIGSFVDLSDNPTEWYLISYDEYEEYEDIQAGFPNFYIRFYHLQNKELEILSEIAPKWHKELKNRDLTFQEFGKDDLKIIQSDMYTLSELKNLNRVFETDENLERANYFSHLFALIDWDLSQFLYFNELSSTTIEKLNKSLAGLKYLLLNHKILTDIHTRQVFALAKERLTKHYSKIKDPEVLEIVTQIILLSELK